jgi:hypothetical protein
MQLPNTTMPSSDSTIPAAAIIETDVPCRSCGYNLRTLAVAGICPECATPVSESLRGDLLRYADPNFLRRLMVGTRLVYWATALLIFYSVFVGGVFHSIYRTLGICLVAASALIALGTWLLTTPDPSGVGEEIYGTLRTSTRLAGMAQVGAALLLTLEKRIPPGIYFFAGAIAFVLQFGFGATLMLYLQRLSKRALAHKTRDMKSGFILFCMVYAIWLIPTLLTVLNPWHPAKIDFLNCLTIAMINVFMAPFAKVLKPEMVAAKLPTTWRIAGLHLYSVRQLFRSKNADDK